MHRPTFTLYRLTAHHGYVALPYRHRMLPARQETWVIGAAPGYFASRLNAWSATPGFPPRTI